MAKPLPQQSKIAHFLRQARAAAGLSLRELASRAHTSHSTILVYEQGKKVPSAEVFLRLLNACGFEITYQRSPRVRFDDPFERGNELEEVLNLAEQFPSRPAKELQYPRFGVL